MVSCRAGSLFAFRARWSLLQHVTDTGGPIFETAVLLQVVRAFVNRGEEPQVHFWQMKLSATPRPAMASGIRTFQEDLGELAAPRDFTRGELASKGTVTTHAGSSTLEREDCF